MRRFSDVSWQPSGDRRSRHSRTRKLRPQGHGVFRRRCEGAASKHVGIAAHCHCGVWARGRARLKSVGKDLIRYRIDFYRANIAGRRQIGTARIRPYQAALINRYRALPVCLRNCIDGCAASGGQQGLRRAAVVHKRSQEIGSPSMGALANETLITLPGTEVPENTRLPLPAIVMHFRS